MAVSIVPAVLASTPSQLRHRLRVARRLSSRIHLDIMDGHFVVTRSVAQKTVRHLGRLAGSTVHLMVRRPAEWLETVKLIKCRQVILHVELGRDLPAAFKLYRGQGITVSVAINPGTPLSRLYPFVRKIHRVVVMGVRPGRYGARFQPKTLARIRQLHRHHPRLTIACDGGMNERTIPAIIRAGAREVIVGSDLILNTNPTAEWRRLQRLTKQ